MSAEFVLLRNKEGMFVFVFKTERGQVLLTSGAYSEQEHAWRQLQSARHMARKERNYELRTTDQGGFYFVVKNNSKDVLAQSEMFPDPESRRQGMILTRACSHGARIESLVKERFRKGSSADIISKER